MSGMMAYKERVQQMSENPTPAEIQALDARIERLHERLAAGDPDLEPDELQFAIDAAQRMRRERSWISNPRP